MTDRKHPSPEEDSPAADLPVTDDLLPGESEEGSGPDPAEDDLPPESGSLSNEDTAPAGSPDEDAGSPAPRKKWESAILSTSSGSVKGKGGRSPDKSGGTKKSGKSGSSTALTCVIIVLAVLLVAAIVFICYILFWRDKPKDDTPLDSSATSEDLLAEIPPDPATQALYDTPVLTIGDITFDYETYRYFFLSGVDNLVSQNGDGYLETSEGAGELAELREDILDELKRRAAVMTLAKEKGIELTDEKTKEIDDSLADVQDQMHMAYGTSMTNMLSTYNMTMAFYREEMLYGELENELYTALTASEGGMVDYSDETVNAYAEGFFHVEHILYGYNDGLSPEEARAKAEETLATLTAIEDIDERKTKFDELMTGSNDYQQDGNNFYYYRHGEMNPDFEAAVDALGENELSSVVETSFGYHVILRLPLDMEFFRDSVYPSYAYNDLLDQEKQNLTVSATEFYDTLTPQTAK